MVKMGRNNKSQYGQRYYDSCERRLIYCGRQATPDMWDDRWELNEVNARQILAKHDKRIISMTRRFLQPEDGLILEGGCGNGRTVYSLVRVGYSVVGIDFAARTVNVLNRVASNLDIRLGDVRQLPLGDSTAAGYWSLGVIEHFYEGYHEIALEMARVIKPGGYLFLSHPYMSPIRKAKAQLGLYRIFSNEERPKDFYQFALDHRSVIANYQKLGFNLCLFKKGAGLQGFCEEVPFGPILGIQAYSGNNKLINGIRFLLNKALAFFAAHSCFMVFRLSIK